MGVNYSAMIQRNVYYLTFLPTHIQLYETGKRIMELCIVLLTLISYV